MNGEERSSRPRFPDLIEGGKRIWRQLVGGEEPTPAGAPVTAPRSAPSRAEASTASPQAPPPATQVPKPKNLPSPRSYVISEIAGIYRDFHSLIIELCLMQNSVREEMMGLSKSYRESMPRTRLQLFPWAYPKGSPPRALYWVRLAAKKEEFYESTLEQVTQKRPRWCTRLKIKCRSDLRNHIHWNGMDFERKKILYYYELAEKLRRVHRLTSRKLFDASLPFTMNKKVWGELKNGSFPRRSFEDRIYEYLSSAGSRMLDCAWGIHWINESDLARIRAFEAEDLKLSSGQGEIKDESANNPGSSQREREEFMKAREVRVKTKERGLARLQEIAQLARKDFDVYLKERRPLLGGKETWNS